MDFQKASELLGQLINSKDKGSLINTPEMLQALNTARIALSSMETIKRYKGSNSNSKTGRVWNEDDEKQLLNRYNEGASIPTLATEFGRTPSSILARLRKLGVTFDE